MTGNSGRRMPWLEMSAAITSVWILSSFIPALTLAADPSSTMVTPTKEIAVRGTSDFAVPHDQFYQLGFVALIGLATLLVQTLVLMRTHASLQGATRITMITLIITLAVGTLVMGYDEKQIAPVIGLFGSIVGYLLGRGDRGEPS